MSKEIPVVGDAICIDHIAESVFYYGNITKIENDLVYALVNVDGDLEEVCGDVPTSRVNGIWVIDSF